MTPASTEAEYALIGVALVHSDSCAAEIATVTTADFYDASHRAVWDVIRALVASGKRADPVTVADALRVTGAPLGLLDGASSWLLTALREAPTVENAAHYAGIVRSKSRLRSLMAACAEISHAAATEQDADAALSLARERLAEIENYGSSGDGPISAADAMGATLDAIEARKDRPEDHAIMTGIAAFDRAIGGMKREQLVIVAGPPGMGKTAWAMTVGFHNASAGVPTLIVSLEMGASEVLERFLSQQTGIPGHDMATGAVARSVTGMKSLYTGAQRLSKAPLWIEARCLKFGRLLGEIRTWHRRHVIGAGKSMGLIVIDYLGLILPDTEDSGVNRTNEVAKMTRALKMLAKDLKSPLVLLSQLNRQYAQTDRPQLSQLRDSGAIEQDANMVIFPWREMPTDNMGNEMKNEPGPAEWIVAKNRNGPTGTVAVYWQAQLMKFVDSSEIGY